MKTLKQINIIIGMIVIISFGCKKEKDQPQPIVVQQTVPVPVYRFDVTQVKITAFPLLNGNSQWDFLDDADLFITLNNGSTELFTGFFLAYTNVITVPVIWNLSPSPQINNVNILTVKVWDKDVTSNEFMGSVAFNMNDYITSKPTVFSKTNGNYSIELTGVWI